MAGRGKKGRLERLGWLVTPWGAESKTGRTMAENILPSAVTQLFGRRGALTGTDEKALRAAAI